MPVFLLPFLTQVAQAVVTSVVTVAVPVVVAYGAAYLRRRWKLNITSQQQAMVQGLAVQAAMTASQKFSDVVSRDERNTAKLDAATEKLIADAQAVGVSLSASVAADLVEAAVNQLKRDAGKETDPRAPSAIPLVTGG